MKLLLNTHTLSISEYDYTLPLLEWIRDKRGLTATKEGCGSGDCGACTLLVGKQVGNQLEYQAINSCIALTGSVVGCHVITLEAVSASYHHLTNGQNLADKEAELHPVQQALIDNHASQCGFCTPGIVMSMLAWWLNTPANPMQTEAQKSQHRRDFARALSGNLCRCTGYHPIYKAGTSLAPYTLGGHQQTNSVSGLSAQDIMAHLATFKTHTKLLDGAHYQSLHTLEDFCEVYKPSSHSDQVPVIVAGSTDLGLDITQHLKTQTHYIDISRIQALKVIRLTDAELQIGAGVTYTQLEAFFAELDHESYKPMVEAWQTLLPLIGSQQVRNRGTLGGNIANGSPIADTPPLLMALQAKLTLQNGTNTRQVALSDFYIGYRDTCLQPQEIITHIHIPKPSPSAGILVQKVSKREEDDISAVCIALVLDEQDNKITACHIGLGGVAATPVMASSVQNLLLNRSASSIKYGHIVAALEQDITPLSDVRASANYRQSVCANQLFFWLTNSLPSTQVVC